MAMLTALTRRMAGDFPEQRPERREGYVALADVLTLFNRQDERTARAIDDLKETYRSEAATTRSLVDQYRVETNRRLDALEDWREAQEDAALIRQGKAAVVLGTARILAKHWQLVWAFVILVLGLVWTAAGNVPIGVGPVQP